MFVFLTENCDCSWLALTLNCVVGGNARVVGHVRHPGLEDQQISGGRLNQVRVLDLFAVLQPVTDSGFGTTFWWMAPEFGLAPEFDLLRIWRCVEFLAQI